MAKPQGNHPLRYPTIHQVDISKEEMQTIISTGLIKHIDENGFIIFDADNLSGSHVYWSNLKEIWPTDNHSGIILIYKNLSDEVLPNTYANWDSLMDGIPEEFGHFQSLQLWTKSTNDTEDDFEELTGMDVDEAKELVSGINEMRAAFMEEDAEEKSEIAEGTEDVLDEINTAFEEEEKESLEEETLPEEEMPKEEAETRYEVEEYETSPKLSDQALLEKILAEATGSSYGSENLRFQRDKDDLKANTTFNSNARIEKMGSLGFEVIVGTETHEVDFGRFSDAFFNDRHDAIIFEHRNGKTLTFPSAVGGWQEMIAKMPFRFRSFDRKKMLELVNEH